LLQGVNYDVFIAGQEYAVGGVYVFIHRGGKIEILWGCNGGAIRRISKFQFGSTNRFTISLAPLVFVPYLRIIIRDRSILFIPLPSMLKWGGIVFFRVTPFFMSPPLTPKNKMGLKRHKVVFHHIFSLFFFNFGIFGKSSSKKTRRPP